MSKKRLILAALMSLAAAALTLALVGSQNPPSKSMTLDPQAREGVKLLASDASKEDGLGWAVSIHEDTIAGGALFDGGLKGAVYIYERDGDGWTETHKLTADDGGGGEEFGASVSLDGDTLLIGTPFQSEFAGVAYIFVRDSDGWRQQAKLFADEQTPFDEYASYVALKGDIAVVGNPLDDDGGTGSGAVFVYERNGEDWPLTAKLIAEDAQEDDNFGRSVAFDGESILVGAPNEDEAGLGSGAAYVFVRDGDGWKQQAKLMANDAVGGEDAGRNVHIDGDTAVVASPWTDGEHQNSGAAYVFVRNGDVWTQQAKLTSGDPGEREDFGRTVFVENDTIIVGATRDNEGGVNSGALYAFDRSGDTWTQTAKLLSSDPQRGDEFGRGIAMHNGTIVVGAPFDDDACPGDSGCDSGSLHVFEWEESGSGACAAAPGDNLADTSWALLAIVLIGLVIARKRPFIRRRPILPLTKGEPEGGNPPLSQE